LSRFSKRFNVEDSSEHVLVDREPSRGIVWITLNRPEKLNALTVSMREYLNERLWDMDMDDDVRVVVLRGNGRAFCAGHDLTEERTWSERPPGKKRIGLTENATYFEDMIGGKVGYHTSLRNFSKIVISQIHGYAYGGGFGMLAVSSDLLVVSEDARLGLRGRSSRKRRPPWPKRSRSGP
jgi:enoyl-CoA hydratase/carnithine racemase